MIFFRSTMISLLRQSADFGKKMAVGKQLASVMLIATFTFLPSQFVMSHENDHLKLSDSQKMASNPSHAKRYLRINEYLFNGTQKKTAVAAVRTGDTHRSIV